MTRRLLMLGLVLSLGLSAEVKPAFGDHERLSALLPANALKGSRLFAEKGCLRCHAIHGVGGVAGPDLGRAILNRPLLEIAGVMWNHSPGMERAFQERRATRPAFEPSEMASLLAFLYFVGSLDPPGEPAVGARLFRQKGCQTCHSLGGKGGGIGPPLDKYGRYASPLHLAAGLWGKGKAMAEAMAKMKIPRPLLEGNDIPDLLAYVRSAGGGVERVYVSPGSPKRGEELFAGKGCVTCHAVRGHGAKGGPDLGFRVRGSLMRIAGSMGNHGPAMWVKMAERGIDVPALSPEELSDLISYLYFFQFLDPPGDPGRGSVVYREKRCGACHALRGVGEKVGPDLATVVEQLGTPLEVITAMWNHAGRMGARMAERNIAWPVFKGGELADLIAYLHSARGEPGPKPGDPKSSEPSGARR